MNPDALDRGIAGGDPLLQQYLRKLHEGFGNTPWEGMDLNMETYGGGAFDHVLVAGRPRKS